MDKDFFVEELQTHHAMLYRVAYTILQNDDACCDALQDAALKELMDASAFSRI